MNEGKDCDNTCGCTEGDLKCANGRELKCRNGEWVETGYSCLVDNKYFVISTDGLTCSKNKDEVRNRQSSKATGCIKYVGDGSYELKLYNSCDQMKTAVILWSDEKITRHQVSANSFIKIPNRASWSQIIDED